MAHCVKKAMGSRGGTHQGCHVPFPEAAFSPKRAIACRRVTALLPHGSLARWSVERAGNGEAQSGRREERGMHEREREREREKERSREQE